MHALPLRCGLSYNNTVMCRCVDKNEGHVSDVRIIDWANVCVMRFCTVLLSTPHGTTSWMIQSRASEVLIMQAACFMAVIQLERTSAAIHRTQTKVLKE